MTAPKANFYHMGLLEGGKFEPENGRRSGEERRKSERRSNVFPFLDKENRLRFAARAAGFGIYDLDCATGDSVWSPELKAMAGLPVDDSPISMPCFEALLHPDDRVSFMSKFEASLDPDCAGLEGEFRLLRPDGAVRWIRARGQTFFAGAGSERHPLIATGIVIDITASRAAEQAVLESRTELGGLIESVIDAIISIDAEQRIVLFNPAACRMFRCSMAEALGSPIERFIPVAARAAHREHVRKFVEAGASARSMGQPGAFSGLRADREEFPIEVSISKIQVSGQWRLTAVVRDVTERTNAEAALRRLNEQLECRIEERTAELIRSNEALERSNLDLQQFAYIAAHDLQTPLRSISGFAQLLQKDYLGKLDAKADVWLSQLMRAAQHMHALVQDLLSYSRVDSRGGAFRPVDFRRIFDEVATILDMAIRESQVQVSRDDLPIVMGDPTQLAQVVQNLIDNGIKYRGREAPRVHVAARKEGEEWLFSVRDNGIGIAAKHRERIFDIFYRLHTQQEYPGTGIGLAVCRRVIHRHGGRIWVESQPGKGSAFYFTLPARASANS